MVFHPVASSIRSLYFPVQPDVKVTDHYLFYQEFLPDLPLQSTVYCYWQLQTQQKLAQPFTYRVVADGCIDIFFEVNHPAASFVMGFCKSFIAFELGDNFNYFGIRFLPTKFPLLFGIDAITLTNQSVALDTVLPIIAKDIATKIRAGAAAPEICQVLNDLLTPFLGHAPLDSRLAKALTIILQEKGNLQVERDLAIGLSSRQLRRLFEYYIGTSPKAFCKVVRFQYFLGISSNLNISRNPSLFLASGYFDQAHFIKEFKKLYGLTPNQAFVQ